MPSVVTIDAAVLWPLVGTGLAIAFLHAALPTHWLPFVIAARARGWSAGRTLGINVGAGLAHAAFTALLGAGVAWLGWTALEQSVDVFPPVIAAVVIGVGLFMIWRWWKGADPHPFGHHHVAACDHDLPLGMGGHHGHDHPTAAPARDGSAPAHSHRSDTHVIAGLVALVTLSPCESFLPVYLAGAPAGLTGFAVLSLTLVIGTVLGMGLLTWATFHAANSAPLERIARYEGLILGSMLVVLGAITGLGGH